MIDISPKIQPYQPHPEATIISCYYNPQKYKSRARNFEIFYQQLKRSNVDFLIAECAFGDEKFTLPSDSRIVRFRSKHALWQKEALLNQLVKRLPTSCKYVFWLDADVLFTNSSWIIDAVYCLQQDRICQPFSVAVRLEKGEREPSFDVAAELNKSDSPLPRPAEKRLWRSFARNYRKNSALANSPMFDVHGHTGFAWGARREVLERLPLFDKAIAGTADHIMAHAAAAQIPSQCIEKAFTNPKTKEKIYKWSYIFNSIIQYKFGYVEGELWHLWHGDLQNRQYLSRTQELDEMDFDFDDLELNDDGLYEVREEKQSIIQWITSYFVSRDEDETYIDDEAETYTNQNPTNLTSPVNYQHQSTNQSHQPTSYPDETPNYSSDSINYPNEAAGYVNETIDSPTEAAGYARETPNESVDFGGGGAGGSWENYS